MSRFWRLATFWMVVGGIGTPVAYFVASRDIHYALLFGIPIGVLGGLLVHWWVWRTGPRRPD